MDWSNGPDILVLASHSTMLIRRYCTKAVWLEHGRVQAFGPVDEVLTAAGLRDEQAGPGGRLGVVGG